MPRLSVPLCAIISALVLSAACSAPPQKEIDRAQQAIDSARAAGADQYAPEAYAAATSALQQSHEAVDQRDYRLALSRAVDASIVHPREVFGAAAAAGAAALVLFHNHPSGDPKPSQDDVQLTRRLAAAGVLMGIDVIDHVILADVRYYSFKEEGTF